MKRHLTIDAPSHPKGVRAEHASGSERGFKPITAIHPKSLSTNDEQILSDAKRALHNCGYQQLRNVRVYCDHGRLTLQGRVTTYYLKQISQEVVRGIAHIRDIDNDLYVICPG